MNENYNSVGDDNVIFGNREGSIGSGNVIIGATDSNGNTILNRPMIIGRGAKGGPNDIVIGANAGSGSDVFLLLDHLKEVTIKSDNTEIAQAVAALIVALKLPKRDKNKIRSLWNTIESMAGISGAVDLVAKISRTIRDIL